MFYFKIVLVLILRVVFEIEFVLFFKYVLGNGCPVRGGGGVGDFVIASLSFFLIKKVRKYITSWRGGGLVQV